MSAKKSALAAISVFIFALSFFAVAAYAENNPQLRVSLITWPGMAPGCIAKKAGLFGSTKVDFKILDNTVDRRAAFETGTVDLLVTTLDQFVIETDVGIRGSVILLTEHSKGADGIIARSTVNSIQDLKQKTIAYAAGTPSHYLLLYALDQNGMNHSEIKGAIFDDPSTAGQAFLSGRVDAAVTWEPFLSQAQRQSGAKLIYSTANHPDLIVGAFVASLETLKSRRSALRDFIDGWLHGVDRLKTGSKNAGDVIAECLKMPKEDVEASLATISLVDRDEERQMLQSSGAEDSKAARIFRQARALWTSAGVIADSRRELSVPFDHSFYEEVYGFQ
jgi:NitT/TauT family transport system substrate-binding protein